LRAELDAAIARVNDRGHYILGPEVEAFEREFAAYCGAAACVAVGNGTDALELALRALGVGAGDEVATVGNAGGYATTAIRAAGATPVYVDVDDATLGIDCHSLADRITPGTRAIVVTHLYGRMADVEALVRIAREREIPLIEDCAQAHGAARAGRKAGTFGVLGCYSFYPSKNLGALGDAGALVTGDTALAARVAELRTYGWRGKYRVAASGGMNSRMDEVQAAVLRVKLPRLDAWNAARRLRIRPSRCRPRPTRPTSCTSTSSARRLATRCASISRKRASPPTFITPSPTTGRRAGAARRRPACCGPSAPATRC
jgi:dTDP-4-amino-4,6-dideoxygalactose transaminase